MAQQDGKCFICTKPTSSTAGNPSIWAINLPYPGGNGRNRIYHMGCVVEKVNAEDPLGNLTIRMKLSEEMITRLQAGETVQFRIPRLKNLVNLVKGEVADFQFMGPEWDDVWSDFDRLFKRFGKLFSPLHK